MTDLRLVYGCPKWCTEDHAAQAEGDRAHHSGTVRELRAPGGRLLAEAYLAQESGRSLPQLVFAGAAGPVLDDVQLLDAGAALALESEVQRFAAHIARMTATVRSAAAGQQPKKQKSKKRPLGPDLQHAWPEMRLYLAERDGRQCFYCRKPFDSMREATTDHYVPRSLWSCNLPANLVLACLPCNQAKDDRLTWSMAALLLAWAREGGSVGEAEQPILQPAAAC